MSTRAGARHAFHSFRDYILADEESGIKLEYFDGQIYAMSGGTRQHSAIATAIAGDLRSALRGGPCCVYNSDLRIRVRKTGVAVYPDVSVVCGPDEVDPENENTVTNPIVLVEVTSKSTEKYDRGEKFENYKQIPSLREYLLVSQSEPVIQVWRRTGNRWTSRVVRAGEQVQLMSIDVALDVDAIYQTRKSQSGDHRRSSRRGAGRRRSR